MAAERRAGETEGLHDRKSDAYVTIGLVECRSSRQT